MPDGPPAPYLMRRITLSVFLLTKEHLSIEKMQLKDGYSRKRYKHFPARDKSHYLAEQSLSRKGAYKEHITEDPAECRVTGRCIRSCTSSGGTGHCTQANNFAGRCNNTTEATQCTTSKVCAERVQQHVGVLAQPRLHLLGGKKIVFELTTTLYVLYASCTTCVIDPRFLEPKCGGLRGLRGLSPESGTRRSEVW